MINSKDIIFKILTSKRCKKILKNNFVAYKVDTLTVKVKTAASKKIDSFVQKKKYQMLEKFIDMYSSAMITNFEG